MMAACYCILAKGRPLEDLSGAEWKGPETWRREVVCQNANKPPTIGILSDRLIGW